MEEEKMFDIANPRVIDELTAIADNNKGVLLPDEVVKAAEPKNSILHKHFCWDDSQAAQLYRLEQAKGLIRATVRYVTLDGDRRPVRVFISLREDRKEGRGYRMSVNVLNNRVLRRQMIEDALAELQSFEKKYNHLRELSEVFATNKRVARQLELAWAKAA
jgi:hypothetical protein